MYCKYLLHFPHPFLTLTQAQADQQAEEMRRRVEERKLQRRKEEVRVRDMILSCCFTVDNALSS